MGSFFLLLFLFSQSKSKFAGVLILFDRFDENYALASTQALKNKDIPEGGAKRRGEGRGEGREGMGGRTC